VFDLIHNPEMDFLTTTPQPNPEKLPTYYESDEYISHTDAKRGIFSFLYQTVKKWSLKKKTQLIIEQNGEIGSLLDIGAGTGDFLKHAKKIGWKVDGVEPNLNATELALKKGIQLQPSLNNFKNQQFDVVTLWHVLEHIPNLDETVQQLSKLVKAGGSLIIAVPNFKSYDAEHYGMFWAAYDVPRHLWHFSKSSIEHIFSEDFKLEKIKPMIFDSFYVSLLSEKYISGKKFSLKALWVGFWSNVQGMRTNEYSSHIYCFKKRK